VFEVSRTFVAVVVLAAILVGPAAWVLTDARRRGVAHPLLWAFFALVCNVAGAIVYVLVRDRWPTQRGCATCGRLVSSSHAACPWCGSAQPGARRSCGVCRNELELDWKFCPYCRTEVGRATTPS
jgi:RNA polymerase subunit RPABC4/transcription elongation factor Spt4